jgi:hypothetical protein
MWLDIVTYLHHHGSSNPTEKMPWYRCAHTAAAQQTGMTHQHSSCVIHGTFEVVTAATQQAGLTSSTAAVYYFVAAIHGRKQQFGGGIVD